MNLSRNRSFHSVLILASLLAGCGSGGSGTTAVTPAAATLSATTLTFAPQSIGVVSAPQTVTLTNSGGTALSISSIAVAGTNASAFIATNSCGSSLAPAASCSLSVVFAPTAPGVAMATLALTDSAASSPQAVTLSGTAVAPIASLSATSLSFPALAVGTTSAVQTVTLTNTGSAPLTIASIAFTGANAASFTQGNGCGASVAVNASCAIHLAFDPAAAGPATAALAITDNAVGASQTVALSGTGTSVLSLTKVGATEWDVTNGILNFQFNPATFSIANLKVTLNGVTTNWLDPTTGLSPFGHAIGFYNLYSIVGGTGANGPTTANYYINANFIDMWVTDANLVPTDPLEVESHFVIRVGDTGIHFYQVLRHRAQDAAASFGAATTNFFASANTVTRTDGSTLYYARDIGPNNLGVTNEGFPSPAFTTGILATGPGRQVQAETVDYTGTGGLGSYLSAPGLNREFITKYNYSTYEQFHVAHGIVGNANAFWWVVPSHETMIGGPTKQYLTTVQIEYQSAHLGGTNTAFAAGEVGTRLFGPYYLHFNAFNAVDTTNDQLWAEAAAQVPSALAFYDTETILQQNGYVPSNSRASVTATIANPAGWNPSQTGNVYILSDNLTDFQESSRGYQYWAYPDPTSGTATFPGVLPGTYRLTAYAIGQYGNFHVDNVVVGNTPVTVSGTFQRRNFSTPAPIWTIGIPDRSAHEFQNGHDANGGDVRDYNAIGNYWQLLAASAGAMIYTIGTSDYTTAWPFTQRQTYDPNLFAGVYSAADTTTDGYDYIRPAYVVTGAASENKTPALFSGPNWEIHFTTTAAQIAQGSYVLVSINLAANNTASLQVRINGKHKAALLWYPRLSSDPDVRSGVAGYNDYAVFQFPITDLNAAGVANIVTLYSTGATMYDALKLEIGSQPANPATTGWPEYDWLYYSSADASVTVPAAAP